MKKEIRKILLFSLIFLLSDQIIKIVLNSKMILNQSDIIIKNFLSITLVYNTGAAFSILSNSRILLIIIGVLTFFSLLIYIKKMGVKKNIEVFYYSLLLGGILGNLLDRIIYGYVIDYLSFNFFGYYFPIFNFADVCIVLSIFLIFLQTIKEDLWK